MNRSGAAREAQAAAAIDVQIACDDDDVPEPGRLRRWCAAALDAAGGDTGAVTLRVVGEDEGRSLNETYRGGAGPTNVLSFVHDRLPGIDVAILGDVVICAPVARREARSRGAAVDAHWAHLVVHGTLHLLGHDHLDADEAAAMEALERRILGALGYPDPYREEARP